LIQIGGIVRTKGFTRLGILFGVAFATGVSAQAGLIFDITYTSAVQNDANFASIQSAVNYVTNEFSSLYSDNITINFTINEGAVGLGSSLFSNNYWRGSYTTLRNALIADATTANDATATALANLPVAAPYAPAGSLDSTNDWYATSAEAKALGLTLPGASTLSDGTYTFDNTVSYTYDPNNRAVAGEYDFIGVTEHEFSELMGRTQQGNTFGYDILDTMRFTSTGVRNVDLSGVSGVYYSFNNGNTNLRGYNSGGGDKQDLDGVVATDPFNASTSQNQGHLLSAVDAGIMDVIGYNQVAAVPEPSTFLLAIPLVGFGLMRLRRRRVV
jgi:hypothetical protein